MEENKSKKRYVISKDYERYIALLSDDQLNFLDWLYKAGLVVEDVCWDRIDETDIDFQ